MPGVNLRRVEDLAIVGPALKIQRWNARADLRRNQSGMVVATDPLHA
jgi:hypothetical protein